MFDDLLKKHGPWSTSKVGKIEVCPLSYELKYRKKLDEGPSGWEARSGTALHSVLEYGLRMDMPDEKRVLTEVKDYDASDPPTVVPVPSHTEADLSERLPYLLDLFAKAPRNKLSPEELSWCRDLLPRCRSFVLNMQRIAEKYGTEKFYLEHKAALDENFNICGFGAPEALVRGIIDLSFITRDKMFVVIDHKTGKPKELVKYGDQLRLYALFGIEAHPDVESVQCGINHVQLPRTQFNDPQTRAAVEENKLWLNHYLARLVMPLREIEQGQAAKRPKPLCNWCAFATDEHCPEGAKARKDYRVKKGLD